MQVAEATVQQWNVHARHPFFCISRLSQPISICVGAFSHLHTALLVVGRSIFSAGKIVFAISCVFLRFGV
jgi:hypothetical protein